MSDQTRYFGDPRIGLENRASADVVAATCDGKVDRIFSYNEQSSSVCDGGGCNNPLAKAGALASEGAGCLALIAGAGA